MNFDPPDEKPWGEEEWEKSMRESDVRSAKFGELLETLMDHPNRDEIISREMGWDDEEDEDEPDGESPLPDISDPQEMSDEEYEDFRRERGEVEDIPAYAQSYAWGLKLFEAFKQQPETGDEELEELLGEAIGGGSTAAAKIAGGHGMGYEDHAICGNIVCCKRALEAARQSLGALEELSERRADWQPMIRPLLEEGRQIQRLVEERIAELRSRVWWE